MSATTSLARRGGIGPLPRIYITSTIRRFGDRVLNLTPPETVPVTRLDLEPRALLPTGPA
ncbi:hypothetical protein [Nocardia gipuzkoensis]